MFPRLRWLLPLVVTACLTVAPAFAQSGLSGALVQGAIEATQRRIDLAETLVTESGNPTAESELALAQSLQSQARSQLAGLRLMMAFRSTTEARNHADRAISIVRGLPDPDRVAVQVDRSRELIDRARESIEGCRDDRSRAMLRVALEMQSRAEGALADSRYLAALQLTMSARERTLNALRICNVVESLQDGAARALQRTDDVFSRVHEEIDGTAATQAQQLFARGQSIQVEAQAEFHAARYESALRLTQNAQVMAQRARRIARESGAARSR